MNPELQYISLVTLLFLSSIVYCYANFYSKIPGVPNDFLRILVISLFLVGLEYSIKVPAIYYFGKDVNSIFIYTIMLVSIFICLTFFSKFVLHEHVSNYTYATMILIILILIAHNYLFL